MKDLNTDAMSKAVKDVIALCGIEVLADVNKFQAAIKDCLISSSLKTEQQLLIFSIRIGVGEELLRAIKKPVTEQNRMLEVANALLTIEFGFTKSRSDSILTAIVTALGWRNVTLTDGLHALFKERQTLGDRNRSQESNPVFVKDASVSFGPYSWRVLYVKGNTALLLVDEITDIGVPYNRETGETSWEKCSLRQWLNSESLIRFTKKQQKRILKKPVRAENNPWYQIPAGNQTEDKMFLLSISEVVQGLGDSGHLKTRPENNWTDHLV